MILSGCEAYNLGTGRGTSVLEIVAAFEKASGKVLQITHTFHMRKCFCLIHKNFYPLFHKTTYYPCHPNAQYLMIYVAVLKVHEN
jgi:hypothetical protein